MSQGFWSVFDSHSSRWCIIKRLFFFLLYWHLKKRTAIKFCNVSYHGRTLSRICYASLHTITFIAVLSHVTNIKQTCAHNTDQIFLIRRQLHALTNSGATRGRQMGNCPLKICFFELLLWTDSNYNTRPTVGTYISLRKIRTISAYAFYDYDDWKD